MGTLQLGGIMEMGLDKDKIKYSGNAPVAPTRPLHVGNSSSVSMDSVASSSYASTVLVIFHSFPASVPGPSYARGSGPVNSW